MSDHIEAEYSKVVYTCPHCGTVSQMQWNQIYAIIMNCRKLLLRSSFLDLHLMRNNIMRDIL